MSSTSSAPSHSNNIYSFTIPPEDLETFRAVPWTASLLSNPDYEIIPTYSRAVKPTGEDQFFAATIGSKATIPHCITLRRRKARISPFTSSNTEDILPRGPPTFPIPPAKLPTPQGPPDLITFFYFSFPGVSGHPDNSHGGVIATVLDEIMSLAVMDLDPSFASIYYPSRKQQVQRHDGDVPVSSSDEGNPIGSGSSEGRHISGSLRPRLYTAQLDVRFRAPVMVPGVVVVKAWCVARDGRKLWTRGQVLQEENDEAARMQLEWPKKKIVCADAIGVWLMAREKKL